jgi:hypothetical protein
MLLNFMDFHVNCMRNVDSGGQKFVANFLGYFWARNLPTGCFVLSIENMDENRNHSSN